MTLNLFPDDVDLAPQLQNYKRSYARRTYKRSNARRTYKRSYARRTYKTKLCNKKHINEVMQEEPINKEELTHEENKLLLTLLVGITLGSVCHLDFLTKNVIIKRTSHCYG